MEFEWNHTKAVSNYLRHGVRFETAQRVFDDPLAIDQLDTRFDYDEERFIVVGAVAARILFVAYTLRDHVIHIISARAAEPFERRQYYDEAG